MTHPEDPASDIEARLDGLRPWRPQGDRGRWIRVRSRARTQRRRAFMRRGAAAALVVVVGVGAAALTGGDDPADVDTSDTPTTTTAGPPTTDTVSPPSTASVGFDALTPGWHEVDTGPVPAGSADVEWSGERLYVAVADRLFVHDPSAASWDELPSLSASGPIETDIIVLPDVGAEGTVLALMYRFEQPLESARLDLETNVWTDLGEVPNGYDGAEIPGLSGPRDPNSGRALVWTGERVIDFTSGAVFDPATDRWETLALPDDILAFTHLLYTNPVVVDDEPILAHPHRLEGLRWDSTGSTFEAFDGIHEILVDDVPVDDAVAAPVDDQVLFVSGALSSTLDPATGIWELADSPPGIRAETGCPARAAAVGDSMVAWPCGDEDVVRFVDGEWITVPAPDGLLDNWRGSWSGAGDALVVWHPNADLLDGPPSMRVWVPDPTADPPPADPVSTDPAPPGWAELNSGWHQFAAPPLSPRTGAAIVADGDQLYVVGGWEFLCPPAADCTLPDTDAFRDGAVLDVTTGEWTMLPDTPFPVVPTSTAVVDGALYLRCGTHSACGGDSLLRLRDGAAEWDELPDVPGADAPSQHHLVRVGSTLYAFADSDERGATTDHRLDAASEQWAALPDDPLPALFDRRVVDADGEPLLVGSSLDDIGFPAARYHPATDSWSTVGDLTPPGYQIAVVDGLVHREPHFRSSSGGVLDPTTGTWEFWPALPAGVETDDIVGVVGDDGAAYWSSEGWVWDRRSDEYREIEARPSPADIDQTIGTVGDRLVVYGGAVWPDDGSAGFLSDGLWVWVP